MGRRPILTKHLVLCDKLYDGLSDTFLSNQTIAISEGKIVALHPTMKQDYLQPNVLCAAVVSPGMIDIQINGAADTQFNFTPTPSALAKIAWGARQGGTTHILPTFITAEGRAYRQAIHAVKEAIESGVKGLLGIHLEGPFLSPSRPGIHPPAAIRPMDEEDVAILIEEARDFPGVILLTLAPEYQNPSYLEQLAQNGIVLFAGHSQASVQHLTHMRGVTHLWNAMPGPSSREPGIISEVLGGDRLYAGIIADGIHIGAHALTMSVRSAQKRLCLVTDAMMTLAGTLSGFEIEGRAISLADGRLTSAEGTLAGAHIAMDASLQRLMSLTGIDEGAALQMATRNPAKALQLGDSFGRVEIGDLANLSLFDSDYNALGIVLEGDIHLRGLSH
jgi:N-acetylglucosamine-6-phosphate deacetylase